MSDENGDRQLSNWSLTRGGMIKGRWSLSLSVVSARAGLPLSSVEITNITGNDKGGNRNFFKETRGIY